MVVHTRLRAVVRTLALYCGAGLAIVYFTYHAMNGDHGIAAARMFDQQTHDLSQELAQIQAERQMLERRIALLKPQTIDPDTLDEKARELLGLVHPNDVVVMLAPDARALH